MISVGSSSYVGVLFQRDLHFGVVVPKASSLIFFEAMLMESLVNEIIDLIVLAVYTINDYYYSDT